MDPNDNHKFKLIVRSTGIVKHMYPAEPDMTQLLREGGNDSLTEAASSSDNHSPKCAAVAALANANAAKATAAAAAGSGPGGAHKVHVAPKLESAKFLKTKGKTNFWQLNLRVENEQACKLAVQHIEGKRRDQTAAKMQQLQRMLEHWSSEHDVSGRDD